MPKKATRKNTMIKVMRRGAILNIGLDRPAKHNAVNDALLAELEAVFDNLPNAAKSILLHSTSKNFSAGLDLSTHLDRSPIEVFDHSRRWHSLVEKMRHCGLPVIAAMSGAVIGGGLELAMAAHVRVADETTFYRMPEGRHGIFTGGGASVRVAKVIGADRLTEIMLTGRTLSASEGHHWGLSHYLADSALAKATELAKSVIENAPISNRMIIDGLDHISEMGSQDGLFTESLAVALTQTNRDATTRMRKFLDDKKKPRRRSKTK